VCAALLAAWRAHGVPPATVMEAHCWQSERVLDFMRRAGTELVDASGRPHQKLVERWFGRLWTAHAGICPDGHIGRFRGETWKESKEVQACREGRLDPRDAFPCMTVFLGSLDKAVDIVNRTSVHSRVYGNWVPSERFAAEEPASHRMPEGLERMALPVIAKRTVKRGGMVKVPAANAAGIDWEFAFAIKDGHLWEGAKVTVAFDPRFPERGADIRLDRKQAHGPDFLPVDPAAVSMGPAPVIDTAGKDWSLRWFDSRTRRAKPRWRRGRPVLTVAAARTGGADGPEKTDAETGAEVEKAAARAWTDMSATGYLMDLLA
jgi:hypothetical protein